jgi:hypothetical protein
LGRDRASVPSRPGLLGRLTVVGLVELGQKKSLGRLHGPRGPSSLRPRPAPRRRRGEGSVYATSVGLAVSALKSRVKNLLGLGFKTPGQHVVTSLS